MLLRVTSIAMYEKTNRADACRRYDLDADFVHVLLARFFGVNFAGGARVKCKHISNLKCSRPWGVGEECAPPGHIFGMGLTWRGLASLLVRQRSCPQCLIALRSSAHGILHTSALMPQCLIAPRSCAHGILHTRLASLLVYRVLRTAFN